MSVYREYEVDIPEKRVTIEKQKNGKPALIKYVLEAPYDREKGYAKPKRTTIGHQVAGSLTKMNPTSQFAEVFPDLWAQLSKERMKPAVKRIGMFTAMQSINGKIGIRDILDNVYGSDIAATMIDYVMYSIIHHTDNSSGFQAMMRNELLFANEPYSDNYYSRLFEEKMTQELELLFRRQWALQCKADGVESVWLCIDGSNDDCQSTGVEIAEKGHAKSGKNVNIVSFTYAVTTEGKPVTYEVYRGGLVDAKAMKRIIDFLSECGIGISGVILDRGYCDKKALQYLNERGIAYIIMVKGHPEGYDQMVAEYGAQMKMNAVHLIPHTYLFGVQQAVRLFKKYDHEDYLTLFFDYRNGSERITTLLKNMYEEMSRLEKAIRDGEVPVVDPKYRQLLRIAEEKKDGQSKRTIEILSQNLQKSIDEKGLYGIVSSNPMTPKAIHDLYSSRNASEVQYRLVKGQLGYGTLRVQYTQGVCSKLEMGFIATIVRYEIEQAAKTLDRSVNQMVQELEKIEVQKLNDVYTYTHTETDRQKKFFRFMKSNPEKLIDETVKFENDRLAGRTPAPRRRKTGPKKGSHRKHYDEHGKAIPRKPGVEPGTKRPDTNQDGSARKKPGVPKGTKRGMYNKDGSTRKKPGPKTKYVTESSSQM